MEINSNYTFNIITKISEESFKIIAIKYKLRYAEFENCNYIHFSGRNLMHITENMRSSIFRKVPYTISFSCFNL